ncbi:MAG: DUF4252 domain-containing protein [Saprospiraceae bacterium]
MRNWIFVFVACFATSNAIAQNGLNRFVEQYAGLEYANKLTLQGGLLQLIGNDSEQEEAQKTLTKLNKLTALWIEDFNPVSKKEINYLLKNLRKDRFESLIMVKEGGANVNFMVQENGQNITGVILLVDGVDSFLLINLMGNLQFEDLGNIDLDIEGMDYFKKLPKNRAELKRA